MKKILILPILLSACNSVSFYPYDGDKTIKGEGGFVKLFVSSAEVGLANKFPDSGIIFYKSGLPEGRTCRLNGYIQGRDMKKITKNILKRDIGNYATQSTIFLPIKFDDNSGYMDGIGTAGDFNINVFSNYGINSKTYYGYNVFECY